MNFKRLFSIFIAGMMISSIISCTGDLQLLGDTTVAPDITSENTTTSSNESTSKDEFHIGIVTGTISQSEDEFRGAKAFMDLYGSVDNNGIVKHVTYPDNFSQETETTIAQIVELSDDPLMKVIVVNQSVPGTVAAFERIMERRPDIILLSGFPQEDPSMIEAAADLVVDVDNITRGYLMILAAKKLGATKFVHISSSRDMSNDILSRRRNIMEGACNDLGLEFIFETAPDPTSYVGVQAAQQFILEQMPNWVETYGKDTAFFCTNDTQTEPLLKMVAELGAIFIEPNLPSPIVGYPEAFDIEVKDEVGDWPTILAKVESTVIDSGGSGRMGTWMYSLPYTTTEALAEFGKRMVEGKASLDSFEDLMTCFTKFSPGTEWNGSYYMDIVSGEEKSNHILFYQDTYIFGIGYLDMTNEVVSEKYLTIK